MAYAAANREELLGRWAFYKYMPPHFGGGWLPCDNIVCGGLDTSLVPVSRLPDNVAVARNNAIYACGIQVFLSFVGFALGASRRGLARVSAAINFLTLVLGLLGLWATLRLQLTFVHAHALAVLGMVGLFLLYILASVLVGPEDTDVIILLVFAFLLSDIFVGLFTAWLSWKVFAWQRWGADEGGEGGEGDDEDVEGGEGAAVDGPGFLAMSTRPTASVAVGVPLGTDAGQQQPSAASPSGAGAGGAGAGSVGSAAAAAAADAPVITKQPSWQASDFAQPWPNEFECPITLTLMTDPVIAVDGHSYQKSAIEKWFRTHKTSPKTNERLSSKLLIPNHTLRSQILDFIEQNKK